MSVAYDSFTITDVTDENIFIVYSEYPNGKNGDTNSFSTEPNKYVGIYKGTATSAPTDASLYSWSQLVGDPGAAGTGILSIIEEYYLSTSKTTQTGGYWDTIPPTWESGKYIWTRSKIVYINPSSISYTTPICDSSWEAINDIEIGGTQLLQKTRDMDGYAISSNVTIDIDADNFGVATFSQVNTLDWNGVYTAAAIISFSKVRNKTVTFSLYVRSDDYESLNADTSHGLLVAFALCTGTSTSRTLYRSKTFYTIQLSSEWKKIIWTANLSDDFFTSGSGTIDNDTRLYMEVYNHSVYSMQIKKFKLEYGNKATDWSPAPEDVATVKVLDTEISRVEMKADQANESISLKVWKNDLYITGYDEEGNPTGKNLEQIMTEIFLDTEGILSRVGYNEAVIGATDDAPDEGGSIFARLTELKQSADEIFIRVINENNESSISITDKAINAIADSINMNDTQLLSGGALINHSIKTDALATDAIKSINYVVDNDNNVSNGSFLNLEDGSFKSKYLYWDEYGVLNAQAGYIGGCQIVDGKLQIPGGNITKTSISSDQLDIENIFSNSAIIEKIVSNELFSNAISTNGILSATSDKANDISKRLDELTAQFLELKQNCSVNITDDIYQYHGNGVPTLETYPTIEFFESPTCSESVTVLETLLVAANKYADHIGDVYKNDDNGSYFQFRQDDNGNYSWVLMTQEEIFAISPGVAGIIVGNDSVGIIASNLGVTGSLSIEKDVIGFSFDNSSICTIKDDGVRASAIYCC